MFLNSFFLPLSLSLRCTITPFLSIHYNSFSFCLSLSPSLSFLLYINVFGFPPSFFLSLSLSLSLRYTITPFLSINSFSLSLPLSPSLSFLLYINVSDSSFFLPLSLSLSLRCTITPSLSVFLSLLLSFLLYINVFGFPPSFFLSLFMYLFYRLNNGFSDSFPLSSTGLPFFLIPVLTLASGPYLSVSLTPSEFNWVTSLSFPLSPVLILLSGPSLSLSLSLTFH
ncbi:unnamed protein product [Acanthosepion pharaonis]|uniref:Uncharacterized protein n=1 Tax=Acanthosepion pharaonis TaxID=158019 RepID=A0A812EBF0_ACAPH|nr:unnamed protein product [Sepia pharaonis]